MTFDQPDHRPRPDPLHVAVIMDGNGRWAQNRGWPRLVGHRKGAERVRELVKAAPDLGIKYLTLYAFSTENWKRSTEEVLGLMSLFGRYIRREAGRMKHEGVRMRVIGDRTRLDAKLQALMDWIEEETRGNDLLHLTVAINYGGRDELTRTMRSIAEKARDGSLSPDQISDQLICAHLDTRDLPDPDLVVRTSGETRTSNFLPWQTAYAEYHFTPILWPDFTPEAMRLILDDFRARDRRFGAVKT